MPYLEFFKFRFLRFIAFLRNFGKFRYFLNLNFSILGRLKNFAYSG